MSRKLFAGGLVLVMCLALTMADRVSSQDKADPSQERNRIFPLTKSDSPTPPNLDQMLQELKQVQSQRADLERREKELVAAILNRINEERQQLDQKVQERRRRLEEIERQLPGQARFRDAKEEFRRKGEK